MKLSVRIITKIFNKLAIYGCDELLYRFYIETAKFGIRALKFSNRQAQNTINKGPNPSQAKQG